jgi:hypothetical protein
MAEAVGATQLAQYVEATLASPVMGDTFERRPGDVAEIAQQLGHIATISGPELVQYTREGMGWDEPTAKHVVYREVMNKVLAFYAALGLTDRRIKGSAHLRRLAAGATGTAIMYIDDQSMDRGDAEAQEATRLLGITQPHELTGTDKTTQKIRARLGMLGHIAEKVDEFARLEDAPYVLDCFNNQVLHNEVRTQDLSRAYLESGRNPAFIAGHARELAEIATTSAGFPCVSRGVYATYRGHDESLGAPLAEIQAHPVMQEAEQVWNTVVRIWDELGDWEMDSGKFPKKGIFVINPFNQYDPAFVQRFCELALLKNEEQVAGIQQAFAEFHTSDAARQTHGAYILETLRTHVRDYTNALQDKLTPQLRERFGLYIDISKRVLEIGYVNKIGDIALSS